MKSVYVPRVPWFVSGPVLRVTDPCYSKDTWCTLTLDVVPGEYTPYIHVEDTLCGWGPRVHELSAMLADYSPVTRDWKRVGEVGVDSGQLGFMCDAEYPDRGATGRDAFYRTICDLTCVPTKVALLGRVVFASAGYGDGTYPVFVTRDSGSVVGVCVQFIGPEVDE